MRKNLYILIMNSKSITMQQILLNAFFLINNKLIISRIMFSFNGDKVGR